MGVLQLILGASGSGKSTALFQRALERAERDPESRNIVLVPEQFTLESQQALARLSSRGGILNIDVLSFKRLAFRLFEETGLPKREILTESGKNLIIRSVAGGVEDSLEVLGGRMDKSGYVSEIKSILSELEQYGIEGDELRDIIAMSESHGKKMLAAKLRDIRRLRAAFLDFREERFLTAEELPSVFVRVIRENAKAVRWSGRPLSLCGAYFYLDGFTGFTPPQLKELGALMPLAAGVEVTLTIDPQEPLGGTIRDDGLFAMSKRTVRALTEIARESGTEILEPIVLRPGESGNGIPELTAVRSGEPGIRSSSRFRRGGELEFLEKHFLRQEKKTAYSAGPDAIAAAASVSSGATPGAAAGTADVRTAGAMGEKKLQAAAGPADSHEIHLTECPDPVSEITEAAVRIIELVREEGYHFRETAVVCGDLPTYAEDVRRVFTERGIPVFLDQTVPVLMNPALEFIEAACAVTRQNFSYESVMRLLRTGFAGMAEDETDILETYLLGAGIRGKSAWKKAFDRPTKNVGGEDLRLVEDLRADFMEKFLPFAEVYTGTDATLRELAAALWELLDIFDVEGQLQERAEAAAEAGDSAKEKEYEQVFGVIVNVLDEAVGLLGDEKVSGNVFEEILQAGFSEARIGVVPSGIDEAHVGDLQRTRLGNVRAVFFLGVNEGILPARQSGSGIVSEMEREFLAGNGVTLAPTAREKSAIQNYYLYLMFTKPSNGLYLSWSVSGRDGEALRPSSLIAGIRGMFPDITVGTASAGYRRITSEKSILPVLSEGLNALNSLSGEEYQKAERQLKELLAYCFPKDRDAFNSSETPYTAQAAAGRENLARSAARLLIYAYPQKKDPVLSGRTAGALYGSYLKNSVSRLQNFSGCAFRHFARYGLLLREREIFTVDSAEVGEVMHSALELFSRRLEESGEYSWTTIPDGVRDVWIDKSVDESAAKMPLEPFHATSRTEGTLRRIRRILKRSAWAISEQLKAGIFIPSSYEVRFPGIGREEQMQMVLPGGTKMEMEGRIDRIDLSADPEKKKLYMKIVDYKSGMKEFDLKNFYEGLDLQLAVYMNAASALEEDAHPGFEAVCAGLFISHLQDPLIPDGGSLSPEKARDEILKKLKLNGLVNSDPEILERLDSSKEGTSLFVPVGYTKDGALTAASKAVSGEQMKALGTFARGKLQRLGTRMMSGEIAAHPYRDGSDSECAFCPYSDVCMFDPKSGQRYREAPDLSEKELWEKIIETAKEAENGNSSV